MRLTTSLPILTSREASVTPATTLGVEIPERHIFQATASSTLPIMRL